MDENENGLGVCVLAECWVSVSAMICVFLQPIGAVAVPRQKVNMSESGGMGPPE